MTTTPLTDTQLVLLSAASQREDGLLVQPDRLKGGAVRVVANKIIAAGLAAETPVGAEEPHWRQQADGAAHRFEDHVDWPRGDRSWRSL
jgi:hypothetical protein